MITEKNCKQWDEINVTILKTRNIGEKILILTKTQC